MAPEQARSRSGALQTLDLFPMPNASDVDGAAHLDAGDGSTTAGLHWAPPDSVAESRKIAARDIRATPEQFQVCFEHQEQHLTCLRNFRYALKEQIVESGADPAVSESVTSSKWHFVKAATKSRRSDRTTSSPITNLWLISAKIAASSRPAFSN